MFLSSSFTQCHNGTPNSNMPNDNHPKSHGAHLLLPGCVWAGNTKEGSITLPLTSCLTVLESAVWLLTIFVFICKTVKSKPGQTGGQQYNDTSPFSIPWFGHGQKLTGQNLGRVSNCRHVCQVWSKPMILLSLSHLEIYYSRFTLIVSRLLIVNTMFPTH